MAFENVHCYFISIDSLINDMINDINTIEFLE